MVSKSDFIAHPGKDGRPHQLLFDHLSEVGELASGFAGKVALERAGSLLGFTHDFGKYSQAFQRYMRKIVAEQAANYNPDLDESSSKELKGKIDHSTAGAQFVWRKLSALAIKQGQGRLCGQIMALCIASHHSGLIDCFNLESEPVFEKRMEKSTEKAHLEECRLAAEPELLNKVNELARLPLIKEMFTKVQQFKLAANGDQLKDKLFHFNLGFFTRFLFSCLIDADRLNSAEFEDPDRKTARLKAEGPIPWELPRARLEHYLAGREQRNYVDALRREISANCKANAAKERGIYTLTVPTGGGKTFASLRFALHHAQKHGLERIFYIIPFTSIIEQNAEAIRKAIQAEDDERLWVLEHHSNLEPENQTWQTKLVAENWDAPIVLTTMVQFLETLFSGGTKSVRRLHQLAKSVLIFDEIQTLPISCVHLFCNALNFLTQHCQSTAVLCTATQPLLGDLEHQERGKLKLGPEQELAGDFQRHFVDLNRVNLHNLCKTGGWRADEMSEWILARFRENKSCLVIVNTKAWAKKLYELCEPALGKHELFHLSTHLYPAHRKAKLNEIRKRLEQHKPVLCISTQLIEAGVDVDFADVIRFMAGLDSIAQAAGRCNRNGLREKGDVYLVNPDKEPIDSLKDIQTGIEAASRVLREDSHDLLSPAMMKRYFNYYFYNRKEDMVYPFEDKKTCSKDNLLNLLSDNPNNLNKRVWTEGNGAQKSGNQAPELSQAFMEAGRIFKAIDAPTQAVIVRHGGGIEVVNRLCSLAKEYDAKAYYEELRKAQKYSINVFPNQWKELLELNAVAEVQEGHGIYYLNERFYDENFGLNLKEKGALPFWGAV